MEQISDWFTKLLVGAGLVELKSLPHHLHSAADYVAAGIGTPASSSFAAAVIIYFCVEGFLGGYLGTRMFFQNAFQRSDETLSPLEPPPPRLE